jgi:hypothetical protein
MAVVEELIAMNDRISALEFSFTDALEKAKKKASAAVQSAKKVIHSATAEAPPLEKLKHLLASKKILFASDATSIMITHGANVFHIEQDGPETLRVSFADVHRERLAPHAALDLIQGRNLAVVLAPAAPAPPVAVMATPRGVAVAQLCCYSNDIMRQQRGLV